MKYSESELKLILDKYPKYRKKNQLYLNDAIVAFLKKYEVYLTPPKSNNALDGAITGAVTGIAGADVGGDMAMIQGQSKQTKLQEWTSWKQWALDHKEFPRFQTEFFNVVDAYNKNIDKELNDPEVQKKLDKFISADRERINIGRQILLAFVLFLLGGIVFMGVSESINDDQNKLTYISK